MGKNITGGLAIGYACYVWLIKKISKAAETYPDLKIAIPEDVPVSAVFQEWCRQTGYEFSPDDKRYYYNGGWWEDGAMLAFSHERGRLFLHAFAMSKTLEGKIFFALNAPVWIAKQKRRNKLKQLNKLLRHWQIAPIKMK